MKSILLKAKNIELNVKAMPHSVVPWCKDICVQDICVLDKTVRNDKIVPDIYVPDKIVRNGFAKLISLI